MVSQWVSEWGTAEAPPAPHPPPPPPPPQGQGKYAKEHPQVVVNYLQTEQKVDRLVGPLHAAPTQVHTSPFGVIPSRANPASGG